MNLDPRCKGILLRDPLWAPALLRTLNALRRQNPASCEVVIKGQGGLEHFVHRAVIIAASPVFSELLAGVSGTEQQTVIVETGVDDRHWDSLLSFVYTGEVNLSRDQLTNSALAELKDVCEEFGIEQLKALVEACMSTSDDNGCKSVANAANIFLGGSVENSESTVCDEGVGLAREEKALFTCDASVGKLCIKTKKALVKKSGAPDVFSPTIPVDAEPSEVSLTELKNICTSLRGTANDISTEYIDVLLSEYSRQVAEANNKPATDLPLEVSKPVDFASAPEMRKAAPKQCRFCGKCFPRAFQLWKHELVHTVNPNRLVRPPAGEMPWKSRTIVCPKCAGHFQYSNFSKHRQKCLGLDAEGRRLVARRLSARVGGRYLCGECGKSFTTSWGLSGHELIHRGEYAAQCEQCGSRFRQKAKLAEHMRRHTGEKTKACPVCGKRFFDQAYLSRHMRIHSGEKPYGCEACGQWFGYATTLSRHKKVCGREMQGADGVKRTSKMS